MKAGKLRALGSLGAKRAAFAPEVSTVAETVTGFEAINWYGMTVAAGTPEEFGAFIKSEAAKWSRVSKDAKVRLE